MKANAPEKIYLVQTTRIIDEWRKEPSRYATNIEYTRTDAFIEKAWSWIEDNTLSSNQQDKSRFYYEQFKNYMKGE